MNMKVGDNDGSGARKIEVIGFGRRLAAVVIDGIILGIIIFIVIMLVGLIITFGGFTNVGLIYEPFNPMASIRAAVLGLIISIIYFIGSWGKSGQTAGKSIFGHQDRKKRRNFAELGQSDSALYWLLCQHLVFFVRVCMGCLR